MHWIVIAIIGIIASVAAHWYLKKHIPAIIASSVGAATVVMLYDIIDGGHFGLSWLVGLILLIAVYTIISYIVGIAMNGFEQSRKVIEDDDDD
jgi:hypothetical protein